MIDLLRTHGASNETVRSALINEYVQVRLAAPTSAAAMMVRERWSWLALVIRQTTATRMAIPAFTSRAVAGQSLVHGSLSSAPAQIVAKIAMPSKIESPIERVSLTMSALATPNAAATATTMI